MIYPTLDLEKWMVGASVTYGYFYTKHFSCTRNAVKITEKKILHFLIILIRKTNSPHFVVARNALIFPLKNKRNAFALPEICGLARQKFRDLHFKVKHKALVFITPYTIIHDDNVKCNEVNQFSVKRGLFTAKHEQEKHSRNRACTRKKLMILGKKSHMLN